MTSARWVEQLGAFQAAFSDTIRAGGSAATMGLTGSTAAQNRMFARVGLAVRFEAATFHGYSKQTAEAYSSLMGLFLAWSAFEMVAASTGLVRADGRLAPDRIDALFERERVSTDVSEWAGITPLLALLAELTTSANLRKQLRDAAAGAPLRLRVLVSALRHAFAHGVLSANLSGVSARQLRRACEELRRLLITVQLTQLSAVVDSR